MINIDKLLASKRVEVSFIDTKVDKEFVKAFRKEHHLTQVALANILGVSKNTIEKWEQGANLIGGSSAVLLTLLEKNPLLMDQVYYVKSVDTEESDKWLSSVLWRKCEEELPTPFVSVLAYVPEEAPLPTVHEGYVDDDGKWHLVYCGYYTGVNVTYWMDMPNPPVD